MLNEKKLKRWVEIKFTKFGVHCYPQAGYEEKLKDVSFLSSPHAHFFHFIVRISVSHNEREIEFIQLYKYCESLYSQQVLQADNASCETLAQQLLEKLVEKYGDRQYKVSVYEDNINGAIVEYL